MTRRPRDEAKAYLESRAHLTRLLVDGSMSPGAVSSVVDAGLAGYAGDVLRRHARERPSADVIALTTEPRLLQAQLVARARHAGVRRAVSELAASWHAVGIEVMLFKGFYLAEFVYPDASWRRYADIDTALRSTQGLALEELAELATRVAHEAGWEVIWRLGEESTVVSHHDEGYNGHELLQLHHEALDVTLDAHRRLVHNNVNRHQRTAKAEAITDALWAAAELGELAGAPVWLPAPADSALIGLIASRSWSGDRHWLRPHDYLDLKLLMKLGGISRAELLRRARELGLERTTRLFLRRCDPAEQRLDLMPPSGRATFWYDLQIITERGPRGLEAFAFEVASFPRKLWSVAQALPLVAEQVGRWREVRELEWQPDVVTTGHLALDRRTWRDAQWGVRKALQLHGVTPEGQPELALSCLYRSLTRRGFQVQKRSHAGRIWFEHAGVTLDLGVLGRPPEAAASSELPGWPVDSGERGVT